MKKENPIRLWGPWADNPSAPENFYEANESFVEAGPNEAAEEDGPEPEERPVVESTKEPEDPYASILKGLKQQK